MKSTLVTITLLSTILLSMSCSSPKSVAGEYLAAQAKYGSNAANDASGGDATASTGDAAAETTAETSSPSTDTAADTTTPTSGENTPSTPANTPVTTPDTTLALTYANVNDQVFSSCVGCHSGTSGMGGVSIDTYAKVSAAITKIKATALTGKSMPPSGPLSDAQQDLLTKWIAAGNPEK